MKNDDLSTWVESRTAEGWTAEQVYLKLLQDGWTVHAIQEAVSSAHRTQRSADLRGRVVKIVVGVGIALIAAGVFSFVAANWQAMLDWARVLVIVVATVVISITGWWLRERRHAHVTGAAVLVLGTIMFGAGIFLVAQVYNLSGNWPDGLIMWMIGALAMGAATRLKFLYVLGFGLGLIAAIGYPMALVDPYAVDAFALTAAWLVFAGAAAAAGSAFLLRIETPRAWKDRW
jgi:uncharacterized membrane protein